MIQAIRCFLGLDVAPVGGPLPLTIRSSRWPAVRKMHLAKQPECQVCGTKEAVEVHHCLPVHVRPDLELWSENLLTLCPRDHLVFGHLGLWASWNVDVCADAAAWRAKIKGRP